MPRVRKETTGVKLKPLMIMNTRKIKSKEPSWKDEAVTAYQHRVKS